MRNSAINKYYNDQEFMLMVIDLIIVIEKHNKPDNELDDALQVAKTIIHDQKKKG